MGVTFAALDNEALTAVRDLVREVRLGQAQAVFLPYAIEALIGEVDS